MTILGINEARECFREIDDAVGREDVLFNAHWHDRVPPGIIYNFENIPGQLSPTSWCFFGREVWDFSERNCHELEGANHPNVKHVPVGYHPSMTRFQQEEVTYDVIFCGTLNSRRQRILEDLRTRGLSVFVMPHGTYEKERDIIIAQAKVALNMLYYEDGVFPALRAAHLVANSIPMVQERCPEVWPWLPVKASYDKLVETTIKLVRASDEDRRQVAQHALEAFKRYLLKLPG